MAVERKEIDKLFEITAKHNASDLHLKVGAQPVLRIAGTIRELDSRPLKNNEIKKLVYDILTPQQIEAYEKSGNLDFAYSLSGVGRFRINIFQQRGCISIAARRVNTRIPTFEELHLPPILEKIALYNQGLVLLCGITGSGKSTTIASMIEYINNRRRCHIITVEDPIEYLYQDKKSFINQREVGIDVASFQEALRYLVRQDPDVILIGEMRDAETFYTALTAAETGHLVFGTLHSSTVAQTFGRIFDIFPANEKENVRKSVMFNLRAIICQKLLPCQKPEIDRVPATEIMIANPTTQKLLEDKKEKKIADLIRASSKEGMHDFNQSLVRLVEEGYVSKKVAFEVSYNPEQLKMNLQGIYLSDDKRGGLN